MRKSALKTREFLVTLTTARLLAYKRSLMACHSFAHWDLDGFQHEVLKSDPEWIENMEIVKEILATRPHESRK